MRQARSPRRWAWTMRSFVEGLAIPIALVALGACESRRAPAGFSLSDSAGVQLAVSTEPAWDSVSRWRISSEPEVRIGSVDGPEEYVLGDIFGVRRFSNGRIGALDAGAGKVRVYDELGIHLFDVGRRGDGPAEFRYPQYLQLWHDSIVVYDGSAQKRVWFTPDGQFLRSVPMPGDGAGRDLGGVAMGSLREGGLLLLVPLPSASPPSGATWRPKMALWAAPLYGSSGDSLLSLFGRQQETLPSAGRSARRDLLFGSATYVSGVGDRIAIGATDDYAIEIRDESGALHQLLRGAWSREPTSREIVDTYLRSVLDGVPPTAPEARALRQETESRAKADLLPAFRWILMDTEGNLWVEDWRGAGLETGAFSVFDRSGRWLGEVELPDGLPALRGVRSTPLEVGGDYVLGVWETALGDQEIRQYRLQKN